MADTELMVGLTDGERAGANGGLPAPVGANPKDADAMVAAKRVAVIERRTLVRECLIRSLAAATGWTIAAYDSADAWLCASERAPASLVVLCIAGSAGALDADPDGAQLPEIAARAPIALLSDSEDPAHIVAALDRRVRGYIPTSLSLQVAIEAMRLVRAGGLYIPASSLIASQKLQNEPVEEAQRGVSLFTSRQLAVIEELRRGKANKIIAYELNMRESTVKVHVRNIMKKLQARNRTEVAYLANTLLTGAPR